MTTGLLILARAFHYGSGMMLVGVVAFRWLVLLPAFAGQTDEAWQKFEPLFLRLHRVFLWSGVTLVISGLVLFWAVAAGMSDTSLMESLDRETLGTVLFQTQFGYVCLWRAGFAVMLGILIWRLARIQWQARRNPSALEIAAGLVAVALIVSFAWTGHAAATVGPGFLGRITADALHLLAASVWPAGLLPFALFLAQARGMAEVSRLGPVMEVARRFSEVSLIIVGGLAATGLINSYFLVGSFPALWDSTYGRILCLKLLLFAGMIGIASLNRFRILPLLFVQAPMPDAAKIAWLLQRLRIFVWAEVGLAVAVVLVVSVLGTTPPPR